MSRLREGLLSALAYYEAFGFPLTAQEIFLALPAADGPRPSMDDVERALAEAVRRGEVGRAEGLHFLPGREALACYDVMSLVSYASEAVEA